MCVFLFRCCLLHESTLLLFLWCSWPKPPTRLMVHTQSRCWWRRGLCRGLVSISTVTPPSSWSCRRASRLTWSWDLWLHVHTALCLDRTLWGCMLSPFQVMVPSAKRAKVNGQQVSIFRELRTAENLWHHPPCSVHSKAIGISRWCSTRAKGLSVKL